MRLEKAALGAGGPPSFPSAARSRRDRRRREQRPCDHLDGSAEGNRRADGEGPEPRDVARAWDVPGKRLTTNATRGRGRRSAGCRGEGVAAATGNAVRCAVAEETDRGGAHTAQGTGDSPGTVHAELTSSYEPVSPINLVKKEPSPGRAAPPCASPAPRFHRRRLLYKRGRETDFPGKLFSGSAEAGLWGRGRGPRGASPCALWAVIGSHDERKHVRRGARLHRAGGESALNFFLS